MIFTIARKETAEILRDGRLRWGTGLLTLLLLVSISTSWNHYRQEALERSDARTNMRSQWLSRETNNAHLAAHGGTVLFRPFSALSIIDKGIDSHVGTSLFLEAHRVNDLDHRAASRSASLQQLGEVTPAVVLQMLLPVLIILMVFSSIAGECETGTLRMLLSTGVRPRDLLLGKALGAAVPLLAVLLPAAILGWIATATKASEGELPVDFPRVFLLGASYAAYLAVVTGAAFLVSMRAANSRRALAVLLGLWFSTGVALPRVVLEVAGRLYTTSPPPAATPVDAAAKAHSYSQRYRQRMNQLERDMLAKYNVRTKEELPVSISALMLAASEEEDTKQQRAVFAEMQNKFAAQERIYHVAAFFSPAIAIQSMSAGLAGSDLAHHRHFAEAAEEYRYQVVGRLNDDLIHHPYTNAKAGTAAYRLREPGLYESVAPFHYKQPDWVWALANVQLAALALGVWCCIAALLMRISLRRLAV